MHSPLQCRQSPSLIPSTFVITGDIDCNALKALAESLIAKLGESDPFARKLAKWRMEIGDSDGDSCDRIGRPPQVDLVKDAVKLRMRKEAYTEIYDAWDARDRARKSAAKSLANANRGKQPSGASNRRARELGETGPVAQIIKQLKAGDAQSALQAECLPHLVGVRRWFEEKRLLGTDSFVVPGQQVSICGSVFRGGQTPVVGVIVERAQLCWEQGAHAAPLQSVVKQDKSGALIFNDPAHCHLVRLHDTGCMVRFSPAHVAPWPHNGARVGNFVGRSATQTGIAFRWNVLHQNGPHTLHGNSDTGDTEAGVYHIRRSFYAHRSQLLHMMSIHRDFKVPLRVGDWVWVDVAGMLHSMGGFQCNFLDDGLADMQQQMYAPESASRIVYDMLWHVHELLDGDKYCTLQSHGPFVKPKTVRILLESSYPDGFESETTAYNSREGDQRSKAALWHQAVANKLKSCLPLRSVCIVKAICSTSHDCFEIEETFLADSSEFDVLEDKCLPLTRSQSTRFCTCVEPANEA
jgi:hypothetical protein